MLGIIISLGLCAATVYTLRGGLTDRGRFVTIAGFDVSSMGMGVLAVVAAAYYFGPLYGAALTLTVMIHEFGHVAAYRIAGHADARFRLIPLFGGAAISDQHPASQEKAFFISLMGPGICVAPMALAVALAGSDQLWDRYPDVAEFLWVFGTSCAVINLFNLLPFYPLDGGNCLRILCHTFWPAGTRILTIAMSAVAAAAAVHFQMLFLFVFVLMGMNGLMQSENLLQVQRRMGWRRGLLALAAYGTTTAAHFMGAAEVLSYYF
jgi:Zn-dependent protease